MNITTEQQQHINSVLHYMDEYPASGQNREGAAIIRKLLSAVPSAPDIAGQVTPQAIVDEIQRVQDWINKLPIPTDGATAQMIRLERVKSSFLATPPTSKATDEDKPSRHELQKDGKQPSPCARFCESTAYEIEIRNLKAQLAETKLAVDECGSPPLPQQRGEQTDEVAQILWHRFAPDHYVEWVDETNKAEYRDVASAIIYAISPQGEEANTEFSAGLIERLRIHADNKENTAFARSTMREVLEIAAPAVVGEAKVVARGVHIKETHHHSAGAYARCSYCGRYSDNPSSLAKGNLKCDCGKVRGWCGSFKPPTADSVWSGAAPVAEALPVAAEASKDAIRNAALEEAAEIVENSDMPDGFSGMNIVDVIRAKKGEE